MRLEELVGQIGFENEAQEFKRKLDRENYIGWLKTVSGFANAHGGILYVGVDDEEKTLIGFSEREADSERNYFNQIVTEHISPLPQYEIDFVPYTIRQKMRYILKISILESESKPLYVKQKGLYNAYIRKQGFTTGCTPTEIYDMVIHSRRMEYDILPTKTLFNPKEFSRLYSTYKKQTGKQLTEKMLQSIGFFDQHHFLKQGALFFKDDYSGEKTAVDMNIFQGTTKGANRILALNKFRGNILDGIETAMQFIGKNTNNGIIKTQNGRIDILGFPARSAFEGVVNAFAHRDYYLDNTQIDIDIFRDRLEITSPGSFQGGEINTKEYDLSHIISVRRNALICDVLVRLKYMEASGTGFEKIAEDYRNADHGHKPYIYSSDLQFSLILPDLTHSEGVQANSIDFNCLSETEKRDEILVKILRFCLPEKKTVGEICSMLGISNSSYFRKKRLIPMVEKGYLEESKERNRKVYKTNKDTISI